MVNIFTPVFLWFQTNIDVTTWIKPVDISDKMKYANTRLVNSDRDVASELDGVFMYQILWVFWDHCKYM